MFSKKLILLFLFAAFILLILFIKLQNNTEKKEVQVKIKDSLFYLDVADTDKLRGRGLSGRDAMAQDRGMIFKFSKKGVYPFWMHEMKFSLDFLWLDGNEIVDLSKNIAAPRDNQPENIQTITPRTKVDGVIEINSGNIEKMDIQIGDKIEFIN